MLSRYNDQYKDIYRATKKEYDRLLVKEKANKYDARVKSSDNKMKCLWSICKETTGKNSPKDDCFIDQDPLVLANEFNNHLISVVPNILSSIRKVPFICNISENNESMRLKSVNIEEIQKIGQSLKNKHSSGVDEVPTSIVKFCLKYVDDILCYIINNSLKYGIFPDRLKLAFIKPIYKKGDHSDLNNYRPISLLPAFQKYLKQ
ncbi:uncharacterized protein LOC115881385 [Sitophilus oryzae]|uniref:Uncharacterized protein LOC115881385 n=1 Tax=Sitophilus oryzae TaxID=7048 RepID=A0A6J2XT59_SITOR|nr:uncharacterized protein LOC115881385 [Sitophilus oryzae]